MLESEQERGLHSSNIFLVSARRGDFGLVAYDLGGLETLDEGFQRIVEAPLGTLHEMSLRLEGDLKIEVTPENYMSRLGALISGGEFPPRDVEGYVQKMVVTYNGQTGVTERSMERHHGAQTGVRGTPIVPVLIVKVDEEDPIIDRGICWVYQGSSPFMNMAVKKDRELAMQDIRLGMSRALSRTAKVISDIINGKVSNPAPRGV